MGRATVLIVEDEAIVAADLAGKLGQLGYRVIATAARGEDAVELAVKMLPDVVLMDIRLKGSLDGIETARAIRSRCDLPVIYLTAYSDSATLERAKYSEPFGYILKPFEERELATTIEMALYKHQSDRQLREARDAAEAASRAKSQFLANVSHELRTPMNGVLGALEIVLNGPLEAQQKELLQMAHHAGRSLLRILNDILDISKLEAGKLTILKQPFRLRDCVQEASDILLPEAYGKGLHLDLHFPDDLDVAVMGDQIRIRQVLINLIANAVKFTEAGSVGVRVESAGEAAGAVTVRFTVTDTGIGIPEDKKDVLFKAFSQVDGTDTRQYGGAGLGLAISRGILQQMGGTITFESEEGKGSTFSFTVPLQLVDEPFETAADEKGEAANLESASPVASDKRILIADDDHVGRSILKHMLGSLCCELDDAADGEAALEMWENRRYDLIIMDVQMPRIDGLTVARTIREREAAAGSHTLILAMTAHAFPEFETQCIAAGMDGYLSKPIEMRKAMEKIRCLLQQPA